MKSKEEIEVGLAQFYGTEQYHRISVLFPQHRITDGVKWLCDNADCWWILDIICSRHSDCEKDPKKMLQEQQYWTLKKNKTGRGAKIICERDMGDIYEPCTQRIPYTDFPLPEIKLYCNFAGKDSAGKKIWVILLTSEY